MAESTPLCNFGWRAPDFQLPGTDGKTYSLHDIRGPKGTIVMFICNHCPYVQAVLDRIVRDARDLARMGINTVAISSNDAVNYPEDSFENMKSVAEKYALPFPYLYDETQETARAYGAICTPDFFGFNAPLELQYRGRLDASGKNPAPPDAERELYEAMKYIARMQRGPQTQHPSMGCSIKWKDS